MPISKISPSERLSRFKDFSGRIVEKINSAEFPSTTIKAGETVFRKIATKRTSFVDWDGRAFESKSSFGSPWMPGQDEILRIGRNAPKKDHRWSGLLPNGTSSGIGGSYWGTIHGVLTEDFFYNVENRFTRPDSGLVNPRFAPLVVAGRQRFEKHIADLPSTIPNNGNGLSDILVGVTKKPVTSLEMHPGSEWFRDWDRRLSRDLQPQLDAIGYRSMADGLFDLQDRSLSRLVGNVAADRGCRTIFCRIGADGRS